MSQEARTAMFVLGPAAALALAALAIAWKPWRRSTPAHHGYWGSALAIGLAFCAPFIVLTGWRGVQLAERWHWLAPICVAATLLGLTAAMWRPRAILRLLIGIALAVAASVLFQPPGSASEPLLWKFALGAMTLLTWINLEAISLRRRGGSMPAAMMIVLAGLSVVLLAARQANFSLLAASLAAACGAALAISFCSRNLSLANGGSHVLAAISSALCVSGWLYNFSDVNVWPFVFILAAPAGLWIGELPAFRRLAPWQAAVIRIMLAAIPTAVAVALAMSAASSDAADYSY